MKTIKISDKAYKLIKEHQKMLAKANKCKVSILETIDVIFRDGHYFMPKTKFKKQSADEETLEECMGGEWKE
ncbi:MAG TPA: hypothetical protein VJB05_01745 [archaeon]|nr:hypothetical protein [archaeon]